MPKSKRIVQYSPMLELMFVLTVIAVIDSLSMLPLALLPMTVGLGSNRPLLLPCSFVAGVFVTYFFCGIPLLVGAEVFFEKFETYLSRLWNQPNALELIFQIFLGVLLMISAWSIRKKRNTREQSQEQVVSPVSMFMLGATLVLVGIPGAVPYLAGIERIVRHDPNWLGAFAWLGFYNMVFVLPLLGLIGFRFLSPQKAGWFFQRLADFCLSVMPGLTSVLFFVVGLVMIADGIGWFLGRPLLPVSS